MSRIEKRLWLICFLVCVLSVAVSAGVTLARHESFPQSSFNRIRRALRPDREARKIERASSLAGIETIRLQTTATSIDVKRSDALNDLALTLEGQFLKADREPLALQKDEKSLVVRVDEGLASTPWRFAFDEESRNSSLSIVLPRQFAGRLLIETVSGDTTLEALSLGELEWSSVSGELQTNGGEIHVARLKSVSGNVSYEGTTPEFSLNLTSADATVTLENIESAISPKIDAQSVSGRLDVTVPENASLRISISSFTGEATSSLDLKKSMQSKGALEGRLGAGGGELRLRSVSGNVRLTTLKAVSE